MNKTHKQLEHTPTCGQYDDVECKVCYPDRKLKAIAKAEAHTLTPWIVDRVDGKIIIRDDAMLKRTPRAQWIATLELGKDQPTLEANAAFIVRAVNAYEKDQAELKALREALEVERVRFNDAHEELLRRLKLTAQSFHHVSHHGGYSKMCEAVACRQNYETIAKMKENA
jgi:hypothetical protein